MTVTKPTPPLTTRPAEAPYPDLDQSELWRRECLTLAGYSRTTSLAIALDQTIDLHKACELLAAGCDPRTAAAILL
jgi:hypothetical protein